MVSQDLLPVAVFKIVFHLCHELIRRCPIDDPVVEREAQVPHWSDRNRLVDHDSTLLDSAHSEDANLRLVNNRSAEQAAEAAMVGDRERPGLHLIGAELLGSRTFGQIRDLFRQLREALAIGMPYYRNKQSLFQRSGDPDIGEFADAVLLKALANCRVI